MHMLAGITHRKHLDGVVSAFKARCATLPSETDPRTGRKKPYLYIHRGLPGSLKTTLANTHGCLVISPGDMYSYRCGKYKYDPSKREEARRFGNQLLNLALFERVDVAVAEVLPTFKSVRDMQERAWHDGYNVIVFDHLTDTDSSFRNNCHNVPEAHIQSMADAWQPWPGAINIRI